ncbi:MAG TPA: hypothetical protein VEX39_06610 [Thermoleophilaceae bacterium]|nr:hypothetical protein [Thermoleophilaceae bacterium]
MDPGPWEFGWEALVAIGTLGLAGATALLARTTRDVSQATGRQVSVDQQQILQAQRPVLVPQALIDSTTQLADDPQIDKGDILVAISNVGPGPAISVTAVLFRPNSTDVSGRARPIEAVAARFDEELRFTASGEHAAYSGADTVYLKGQIRYRDVAGTKYTTDFTWHSGGNAYTYDLSQPAPDPALAHAQTAELSRVDALKILFSRKHE